MTEDIAEDNEENGISPSPRWRVSIADLGDAASRFSTFSGRHRVFTVIGSHGVELDCDGEINVVEAFQPFSFDGSIAPICRPDGPTSAFNVMVSKQAGRATVTPRTFEFSNMRTKPSMISVVYIARGNAVTGDVEARAGDCLIIEYDAVELRGDAMVLVAEIDLVVDGA